jgi:hypothetical protein
MGAPARITQYREAGLVPPFPDLPPGFDYMIGVMRDLSPIRPMAMGGVRAADWPEIAPFMQVTGALTRDEAVLLHRMCQAYAAGFQLGQEARAWSPMELYEREENQSAARS